MRPVSVHANGIPEPCPAWLNMAEYAVGAPARRWASHTALLVVDGDAPMEAREVWSFAHIDDAVRRAATAIREAGVKPGQRVLLRLGDGPDFPVAFFGAIAAGAVAMPLSAQLSAAELEIIARDAQPALALLAEDTPDFDIGDALCLAPAILGAAEPGEYAEMMADDPAFLVYTSGSTGRPKGVLHAQRSIWGRRAMRQGWHGFAAGDRVMHTGAFNWTYTLGVGLSDPWSVGATAILNAGSRAPEVWPRLAAQWQPTAFAAVPGLYRRILKYGENIGPAFASLRHALTAGEKLGADVHDAWIAATGKPLLESLGMSEISTYVSSSPARQAGPDYAGWPQPGRRVSILGEEGEAVLLGEEGVLAVDARDPGLMSGYWRGEDQTPDLPLTGEWFITGDRAAMEPDGRIAYRGRGDDLMNAQGYRVAPEEVEMSLLLHPAILEVAVAEYSPKSGVSLIGAWVVTGAVVDAASLTAHCAMHLAAYKIPRVFFTVNALPRTPNGKLMRRALVAGTPVA